ncbi:MAG: SRPBCC family protein [Chloroflexi bacterium]|nr:SRPBCC family protein [Chloroflexota bacterium]
MASVSSSATINQPVEKVFAYVTAADNHKAWQAGILDVKVTPPGTPAVGSIYHYTTEVMGRKMETQLQISALEANHKWAIKTTGVARPVETVYLFEAAGAGTKLTISMELSGGYPAAAEGMIKQQMQKSLDEQGHRVKQMLEK